jgi:hypothetical protein
MTRPVGELCLDRDRLQRDLNEVERFKMAQIYSEYSRGNPGWRSAVLFNQHGVEDQAYIESYQGLGRFTPLAERVPYIKELIEHHFNRALLLWARVMCVRNGFIMPHRDYLDVDGGLIRLHIPLLTDATCVSTEEDRAFHMDFGQICFLDGSKAHAAACLSDFQRIHLCLDFRSTTRLSDVFRQEGVFREGLEFTELHREDLDDEFEGHILELSRFLDESSFFEISGVMGLIHFRRKVDCCKTYEWLRKAAQATGCPRLVDRAERLQREFLGAAA